MNQAPRPDRPARLSSDIGGTFTDVVIEARGRRWTTKVLTDAKRPERGVLRGARMLLGDAELSFEDIGTFIHGTTLATNAVLERRGARTALLTTEGFRDVLEIGTEGRFEQYDLEVEKRLPLVPRSLRLTVPERVDARGSVRLALDEDVLRRRVRHLGEEGIESVAICFLHAYANGAHERRARDVVAASLPGAFVSISSEVCPEIREYERTSTTVANAYVQPQMAGYLARLKSELDDLRFDGAIFLVTSNGGLTSLETARRFPVRLIESGPAGGAIFAADVAVRAGEPRVLAFDMGGTTAKICLIQDATPDRDRVYEVDRAARFQKNSGLPLRIPVIDLVEIGAGGGSVAGLDVLGSVVVGPRSAGSDPGPACYGLGGTAPTVTDANCVLGLIDPREFAGGTVRLDEGAARSVLSEHLGAPLGFSADMAAYAVHEVVSENMAAAARVHAIEKGRSLADHTLVAFGGAAPLHVSRVAEKLGVAKVLVPRNAGVGSAVGFLRAPVSYEVVRSHRAVLEDADAAEIAALLGEMEEEATSLVSAGGREAPVAVRRQAFARYVGQGHELAIAVPDGPLPATVGKVMQAEFERAYVGLFKRTIPAAPVEVLSWSVLAVAHEPARGPDAAPEREPAQAERGRTRSCFDGRSASRLDVPLHRRESLGEGTTIRGPALIAERETTTFVSDKFNASVDRHGNIVLMRNTAPE